MDSTIILYSGIGIGGLLLIVAGALVIRGQVMRRQKSQKITKESIEKMAREDVDHIFNDEFREELRNMGRLHFQKVVSENAMFLKEDLRLTSSQLNEFLKAEVTRHLEDSFQGYDQSLADAKNLAVEAVQKITNGLEEQHHKLTTELEAAADARKNQIIEDFQQNMTDIVNHYLLAAVGSQVDLNSQFDFILTELKRNQAEIEEDLRQ